MLVPAAHGSHEAAPAVLATEPTGQSAHAEAPEDAEKDPALQGKQAAAPTAGEYEPGLQSEHEEAPDAANEPTGHTTQVREPKGSTDPAGQQTAAAKRDEEPDGHALHVDAEVGYCPAAQHLPRLHN